MKLSTFMAFLNQILKLCLESEIGNLNFGLLLNFTTLAAATTYFEN